MKSGFEVRRTVLGRLYDWVRWREGNYSSTPYSRNSFTAIRDMPINLQHPRDKHGIYREGGPWFAREASESLSGTTAVTWRKGWGKAYEGVYTPPSYANSLSFDLLPHKGDFAKVSAELEGLGPEAYNMLRPDLPDFSLAAEIMELKDLPRTYQQSLSVIRNRMKGTKYYKRAIAKRGKLSYAGQWYLAIQFGYIPLYRSINGFVKTMKRKDKLLEQIIRNAQKPVRRQRELKDHAIYESSTTRTNRPNSYPTSHSPSHVTQCYFRWNNWVERTLTTERKTWAVAKFRLTLPSRNSIWRKHWTRHMYSKILGFTLTPDALYQIMPWSWMLDYFTNVGEIVKANSDGVYGAVTVDYFYLMQKHKFTDHQKMAVCTYKNKEGNGKMNFAYRTRRYSYKLRIRGSTFAFRTDSDLTLHQQSILGALGLSKLP